MNIFSKQQLMTVAPGSMLWLFSELIFTLALSGGGNYVIPISPEEPTEAHRVKSLEKIRTT